MRAETKVEILAHRGWWTAREDQNSLAALLRALRAGFGIETDIRDYDGQLVISHDIPEQPVLYLKEFLDEYAKIPQPGTLALNIKADGLTRSLLSMVERYSISKYFVFDMSVPDTLHYVREGATVFTRRSEYERGSALDEQGHGLWLDAFIEPYISVAELDYARTLGKSAALVSPELHKKPHTEAWSVWRDAISKSGSLQCMICTDFPDDANTYFNASNGHEG